MGLTTVLAGSPASIFMENKMFLFFKIFPEWLWPALLILGIIALLLSLVPQAKPYHLLLKIIGGVVVVSGIFINGMLYADNQWKAAAQELQAQVAAADLKSQQVNTVVQEKVVFKTQVVKVRGEETTKYINRELIKYDTNCVIPPEFVQAHNRAAEQPK